MSSKHFYPYSTEPDGLHMTLTVVQGDAATTGKNAIRINGDESSNSAVKLKADVVVPAGLDVKLFYDSERKQPPKQLMLVLQGFESRKRYSERFKGDGTVFSCAFELKRAEWAGEVECQAMLVRTSTDTHIPLAFGAYKGSELAWSEPWTIVFDERTSPPGHVIQIKWLDFKNGNPWLKRNSENIFAIDYSEMPPVILLNEGKTHLKSILSSAGTTGSKAIVRDAVFFQIAHQVWTCLLTDAFNAASEAVSEDGVDLDSISPWHKQIINDWAKYLFPERNHEDALEKVVDSVTDNSWSSMLIIERLPNAIQTRLHTPRGFDQLLKGISNL